METLAGTQVATGLKMAGKVGKILEIDVKAPIILP